MNNLFFLLIFIIIFNIKVNAKENKDYFYLGKKNFQNKYLDKAKLNFERDIVRNPKNIKSYLFLAKIYKIKKQEDEFEKNLNTVLLFDPINEEALYILIKKKVKDGDFLVAKNKLDIFKSHCKKLCDKNSELNKIIIKPKI